MTEARSNEEIEAVQIVVDRVGGYQDGAPEGTVRSELARGLDEAGIDLDEAQVDRLAAAIEEEHGTVDAGSILA